MTKKNAIKTEARARKERFGGTYLHHRHVVAEQGEPRAATSLQLALGMTIDRLVWLARAEAPKALERLAGQLDDGPLVYVALDAADPTGEAIAALSIADENLVEVEAARASVRLDVKTRNGRGENAPYVELMTWTGLRKLLERALPLERRELIAQLGDRFTAPPPRRQVHVLAVGAGELRPTFVPSVELCVCGHPVAEHDARGACTFVGVPDVFPFLGLPDEMVELARRQRIPMKCCCAGTPMAVDASGNVHPLGPAILVPSRR